MIGTLEQIRTTSRRWAARLTEFFVDLNFDPEVGSPDADPAATRERAEAAITAPVPDALLTRFEPRDGGTC